MPNPTPPAADLVTLPRDAVQRLVTGFEHVSGIARQWEPDHSSGADRAKWAKATEACADVAAALAAPPVPAWQPIETAPKDGTEVLMFCPNDYPNVVAGSFVSSHGTAYWLWSEELVNQVCGEAKPSHWMPLPTPPKEQA